MKPILPLAVLAALSLVSCSSSDAQISKNTASSLFWKADGVQVPEIVSEQAVQYSFVGHHGPAVEGSHFALRIYFNDSGAIDVYSKSGKQMELLKYLWYPTEQQQAEEGAGNDEYYVGKTVGLGGIALWDGEKEVKLVATKGRTARAGQIPGGSFAEMIAYGVAYKEDTVDVSIRVEMTDKAREATVIATELGGKKVQFLTGVNFHPDEFVEYGRTKKGKSSYICVWGVHPADVSAEPTPLGAGMIYKTSDFETVEMTKDMVRLISKPAESIQTRVNAASTKEDELNTQEKFVQYMKALK